MLGYYIEVTANHHSIMTGSDGAKARFIHRQTMANAMRFTTTGSRKLNSALAVVGAAFAGVLTDNDVHRSDGLDRYPRWRAFTPTLAIGK